MNTILMLFREDFTPEGKMTDRAFQKMLTSILVAFVDGDRCVVMKHWYGDVPNRPFHPRHLVELSLARSLPADALASGPGDPVVPSPAPHWLEPLLRCLRPGSDSGDSGDRDPQALACPAPSTHPAGGHEPSSEARSTGATTGPSIYLESSSASQTDPPDGGCKLGVSTASVQAEPPTP